MSDASRIVVIGGGHAAAQFCGALAAAGRAAGVVLVCEEAMLPYHRPPLSKAFLKSETEVLQPHRAQKWYVDAGVELRLADPAVAIDRAARQVRLQSGAVLPYDVLVLATGARARRLPHLSADLVNVAVIRSATDAQRLREQLQRCETLTVLGGGFIGLEIAATARALGKDVQILESAPRLLMRAVSPELSDHVSATHRESGIDIRLGVAVGGFVVEDDCLRSLSVDGGSQSVEFMVQGIGAVPEHGLATDALLHCDNGITVDEHMQTSDPAIFAIGDCTSFPEPTSGRRMRLESVQNANDQARTAAASILGTPHAHCAVPWFWSEQGGMRLQMAGLMPAEATRHRRQGATTGSFSILHYLGERLMCVESVNAPADHLAARKLLETGRTVSPVLACDSAVPLKQHTQ